MTAAKAKKRKPVDYKRIGWGLGYFGILGLLWGVWFGFLRPEESGSHVVFDSPAYLQSNLSSLQTASGEDAPPLLKIPFAVIRDSVTSLRGRARKKYADMLTGKRVRWAGWVRELREHKSRGFRLYVDMDVTSSPEDEPDVFFSVSADEAAAPKLGLPVIFEGTIESVSIKGQCIIKLENATVIRLAR